MGRSRPVIRFFRRWIVPGLTLPLVGCGIPRNDAPIATGVPDGFVLARWVVPGPSSPSFRSERVTFAFRDRRFPALTVVPTRPGRFPATLRFGDPRAAPLPEANRVLVVVPPYTPAAAGLAMARTLDEVDPRRITGPR